MILSEFGIDVEINFLLLNTRVYSSQMQYANLTTNLQKFWEPSAIPMCSYAVLLFLFTHVFPKGKPYKWLAPEMMQC